MDKVKIALALLKKHHFWVMTGTVVLLSFIGWYVATSKLWAEYDINKKTIEAKFAALSKINAEERENQKWIEGLESETQRLKTKVHIAWDQVYTEQKTNVLKWPDVGGYKAKLESLKPNDDVPIAIRRAYRNYIRNEFPRLLEIVDAGDEHKDKNDKRAGSHSGDAPHKVIWNAANQTDIFEKLDLAEVPSPRQVRDLQEDLWVYHALLQIIGNMNEFATGNYNAKVKEIQTILIGTEASTEFQSGMAEGRLDAGKSSSGNANPAASAGSAAASANLVGRYVNEKGLPLGETDIPPPEFKRMPIVMRLVMDQREILRLLVQCANSPLPVEVRHLHVHTRKVAVTPGAQKQGNMEKELNSYDMVVELAGLIYIFNPPDKTKLGEVAVASGEPAPAKAATAGAPEAKPAPVAGEAGPANGDKVGAEPAAPATKPAPEEAETTDGMKDE